MLKVIIRISATINSKAHRNWCALLFIVCIYYIIIVNELDNLKDKEQVRYRFVIELRIYSAISNFNYYGLNIVATITERGASLISVILSQTGLKTYGSL